MMKRAKLAAASSLAPGALPPTTTWYEVPRCFACDDPIKSHRFSTSLLQGRTQYSHSSIPGKLGEYIGDGFVVVVTSEDALCRTCMNLLNTMDRLEEELKDHRTRLVANLRRKYGLDSSDNQAAAKLNRKQMPKAEKEFPDAAEISADEEWVPYNKKRKVVSQNSNRSKNHCCSMCKIEFSDLSQFMAHLSKHKDQKDGLAPSNEVKTEGDPPKSFKCGCCTLSFDKKEALAIHMRLHTMDKQQNRPVTATGNHVFPNDAVVSTKTSFPIQIKNEAKPGLQTNAQTIVEMKLIIDAESKTGSSVYRTDKQSSGSVPVKTLLPKEQAVPTSKANENDSGGKVCLLALWNNGSCDHPECKKSSGAIGNKSSSVAVNPQQASHIELRQAEMFIPNIVVQQSKGGVPQVVVSQSEFKLPEVVSHSRYRMDPSVIQQTAIPLVPSVPLAETQYIAITQASSLPQVRINSDTCNSSPQIVVTVPNSSSGSYNLPNHEPNNAPSSQLFLPTKSPVPLTGNENEQSPNLLGGNGTLSSLFSINKHSELGQQSLNPCEATSNLPMVSQLPPKNLEVLTPTGTDPINNSCQSDKSINVSCKGVSPITTERTIVEHDEMGNIAIVNVTSVEGGETTYSKDDVSDWFYNHEQSSAILQPEKGISSDLWINEARGKAGISIIDQIDGMPIPSTLHSEIKEQSDSVDEDEQSEFFTSRYVLDTEKMRKEADAFADAILAVIRP